MEKKIVNMKDKSLDDIDISKVDLLIAASGYEERCVHIPSILHSKGLNKAIVFGFNDTNHTKARKQSDNFFEETYKSSPILLDEDDYLGIYKTLNEALKNKDNITLIVDYTSMSRIWYAAILNWSRFNEDIKKICIYFVYAVGTYSKTKKEMVISSIDVVPGYEGYGFKTKKNLAVFGLGFEGNAALCMLENLEPDITFCYYADPAASKKVLDKMYDENKELISVSDQTVKLPIHSIEHTYRGLYELISPCLSKFRITFIPMGPKPHILSTFILGITQKNVICMRVSGRAGRRQSVTASGELVCTQVTFQ